MPRAEAHGPEGATARWRRRLRPIMLVALALLTAVDVWVCTNSQAQKEKDAERAGFVRYISTTYRTLQVQTASVTNGLAGLVDETAPSAAGAVDRLDHEIVPNLEYIAEQGWKVVPDGETARALHSEYLHAILGTKEDAARLRSIFSDESVALEERRQRARALLHDTTSQRFQTFAQHVRDAAARMGAAIVLPAALPDAGTPKK